MWQTTVQFPTIVNVIVYIVAVVLALLGFLYIWRRGRSAGFVMRWTTQDILVLAIMGVLLEVYDNLIGDQFITPVLSAAGLAFSAALRFLPQMMERMTVLLQVVQVRGYDLTIPRWWEVRKWPGYLGRVFACIPVITIPLLIGSLRTTSVMAMVVDARAFGTNPRRTNLREHPVTLADRIALGLLIGLTLLVILLLVFNIGNRPI